MIFKTVLATFLFLLASCVTAADMRNLSDTFERDLAQAEARTGEEFVHLQGIPAALADLADKQQALEDGTATTAQTIGGGLGALVLGGLALLQTKKKIHAERDTKYKGKVPGGPA